LLSLFPHFSYPYTKINPYYTVLSLLNGRRNDERRVRGCEKRESQRESKIEKERKRENENKVR
jgi:hypothetical protein